MNLSSKVKIFSTVLCLSLLPLYSSSAMAVTCSFAEGKEEQLMTLNFGNVILQRDTAVGQPIQEMSTGAWVGGGSFFGCGTVISKWTYKWELLPPYNTSFDKIAGVYKTPISGIGIRVTNTADNKVVPYETGLGNEWIKIPGDGIKVELIRLPIEATRTGNIDNITNAKIAKTSGSLWSGSIVGGYVAINIASITPVKCTVNTASVDVPLGEVTADQFTGVGSTPVFKDFNIGLSCDPKTKVNVTLSADKNTDIDGQNTIFNLTGYGRDTDVAEGIGVQILYDETPLENNQILFLKESQARDDGENNDEMFNFTARYYQTKPVIRAGKADATATLVISYQ